MHPAELAARLQASRDELEAALAGLADNQWTAPGAEGAWSVQDVLAHLTAWEVELVTGLGRFQRGQAPGKTQYSPAEIEALNQRRRAEAAARPLERVLADLRGVRRQTIRQVQTLAEAELNAPRGWLAQGTIADWVLSWVVEHEAEHAQQLARWRAAAGRPAQPQGPA